MTFIEIYCSFSVSLSRRQPRSIHKTHMIDGRLTFYFRPPISFRFCFFLLPLLLSIYAGVLKSVRFLFIQNLFQYCRSFYLFIFFFYAADVLLYSHVVVVTIHWFPKKSIALHHRNTAKARTPDEYKTANAADTCRQIISTG